MIKIFIILLISNILTVVGTCHPECKYQCDDPVCPADCIPVCIPPVCSRCINVSNIQTCHQIYYGCISHCPEDMCEADSCPQCETRCYPYCEGIENCQIMCEELQCSWKCSKPSCRKPICSLQCEAPACKFTRNDATRKQLNFIYMISIILFNILS